MTGVSGRFAALDLTQAEFAGRIGIREYLSDDGSMARWKIGAEILLRISREFAQSVEWLLTGEG